MRFTRDVLKKTLPRPLILALAAVLAIPAPAQTFFQPKVIPTGNWPAAVYSADINNDGYPDLIYIDQGATQTASTTHVLLNDGKGNFTASATIATAGTSIAVADVNGDGKLDLAWVTYSTTFNATLFSGLLALGKGDGTFQATSTYGTFSNPTQPTTTVAYVAAGHFSSKTGLLDLVFENTATPTLFVLKYLASASIAVPSIKTLPNGAGPVTLADLNADGLDDIVLQQGTASAAVFLGNIGPNGYGLLNQTPTSNFTGTTGVHSLLIHDVNLDGRPDLIAEGANGRIDVFPGNGDGTFQSTSSGGTGTLDGLTGNGGHLIAIGDFNHDNQFDALTATPIGISALLGHGTQYLGLKGIYNAGPGHTSYVVADFNHDGNLDLALDSPEGIAILYGNSDGSFQTSQAFAAGQPAMSSALGYLANLSSSPPHLDAVVSTGSAQAQVLLGDGTGKLTPVGGASSPTPTTPQNGTPGLWGIVHIGEFFDYGPNDIAITADGGSSVANGGVLLPLASASAPSGLIYQQSNGAGTFQPPVHLTGPAASQQTANSPAPFYGVSALQASRNPSVLFTRDSSAYRYTGDSTVTYPLQSSLIFGTQTTFTSHAHNLIVTTPTTLNVPPIVVAQQEGDLFVYSLDIPINMPLFGDLAVDGSLTTPGQPTAPDISPAFPGFSNALGFRAFPGSAVISDLDGDQNADLLVAYDNMDADHTAPTAAHPNKIYIWYGSGSFKFLTSAKHPVNPVVLTPSRNYYQIAIADMNGDSIPDLILSDGYIVSIQLGKGDGTFGAETHYLAGQGINGIAVGDLRGTGHNDIVVANGGTLLSNPVANKEVLVANPDVNTGGVTVLLNQATAFLIPPYNLTASPEPSPYGSSFVITASFPLGNGSVAPYPTGTVTFSVDALQVGPATINSSGVATVTYAAPNTLSVGNHALTATYSGDSVYQSIALSGTHAVAPNPTNLILTLCVDAPGSLFPCGNPIGTTPLISPITLFFGQSIDGVVAESASNLTGNINLYDGSRIFCTLSANLSAGSNVCPTQSAYFNAGSRTVYAMYTGDPNNGPSNSNSIAVTVFPDITTGRIASSLNPAPVGSTITFTAVISGNFATPNGTVNFFDGATLLGVAPLDPSGTAQFTTSTLAVGSHPISVVYNGNSNFNPIPITAVLLTQVITGIVTPPPPGTGFSLSVTPNPVTVGAGATGALRVVISALSASTPPIALTCSGLPIETTCSFVTPIVPAGGGITTLQLHVSAPHDCGTTTPYFIGSIDGPASPVPYTLAAVFCGVFAMYRRRRKQRILPLTLVLVALGSLASLSGCGHCTDLGTRPGNYTFTVTATPQGTSTTPAQSVTIPLTVTIP